MDAEAGRVRTALLVRAVAVLCTVIVVGISGSSSGAAPRTETVQPAAATASPMVTELDVQPAALTRPQLISLLDRLRANGVTVVSTGVNWNSVRPEPAPSPYRWDVLDGFVDLARERGLTVRFRVAGSPLWLHPDLVGVSREDATWYPPTGPEELAAWSGFVTDLATRYGNRISAMEIWNEPNESWFWKPAPDPAAFAALLRTAYLAIERAAPQVTVTSGGLSHNDLGFLGAYYDAASAYSDAAANYWFFDHLGLHPYSADRSPDVVTDRARYQHTFGTVDENFLGMSRMVELTAAHEGRAKRVWISEFGYSTAPTPWYSGVPEHRRAYFLARTYELARRTGFVDGLGWYHSHPTPWDPPGYDILTADGETETFAQLARMTGARPATATPTAPVGSTTRGVVRVLANSVGLKPAPAHLELYVDGALVASGERALSWDSRSVVNGGHTIQLVAWSSAGTTHLGPTLRTTVRN